MKELLETLTALVPVIQSSPMWVKAFFVAWFFATASLGLSIAFTYNPSATPVIGPHPVPLAVNSPKAQWPVTGDSRIDQAHTMLNNLGNEADETAMVKGLRAIFYKPVFLHTNEEPVDRALFTFCRSQKLLEHYVSDFNSADVRRAIGLATQQLIILQDKLGKLYGPIFDRQKLCDKYSQSTDEYASHLPPKQSDRLGNDANHELQGILADLRTYLAQAGLR